MDDAEIPEEAEHGHEIREDQIAQRDDRVPHGGVVEPQELRAHQE